MDHEFRNSFRVEKLNDAAVAAKTDLDSAVINLQSDAGYGELSAIYHFGAIVDAATIEVKVIGCDDASKTNPVEKGTSGEIATGSADNNKILAMNFVRPDTPYAFFRLVRDTQNVVLQSATALLGRPYHEPANNAALLGGKVHFVKGN